MTISRTFWFPLLIDAAVGLFSCSCPAAGACESVVFNNHRRRWRLEVGSCASTPKAGGRRREGNGRRRACWLLLLQMWSI